MLYISYESRCWRDRRVANNSKILWVNKKKRGRESEFYNYMADNSINNIGIFLWSRWKVGIIQKNRRN